MPKKINKNKLIKYTSLTISSIIGVTPIILLNSKFQSNTILQNFYSIKSSIPTINAVEKKDAITGQKIYSGTYNNIEYRFNINEQNNSNIGYVYGVDDSSDIGNQLTICDQLNVIFPQSSGIPNKTFDITTIYDKAFAGKQLENVILNLGNNIQIIGEEAFQGSVFKNIIFPGQYTLPNQGVVINNNQIKQIKKNAFNGTWGIPGIIVLNQGIEKIEQNGFNAPVGYKRVIYYSTLDKNTIQPQIAFGNRIDSIEVLETKFKDATYAYNNKKYIKVDINDLSSNQSFVTEDQIKTYILSNIDLFFENYPLNSDHVNDITSDNISFTLKRDNNKNIYIEDLSLNYYNNSKGNVIYNSSSYKQFGNILLLQKMKATNPISVIEAKDVDYNWANQVLTDDFILSTNWQQRIFDNIHVFVNGDYLITSINNITVIGTPIIENETTLKINWTIKAGSWYDENGNISSNDLTIETRIINFDKKNATVIKNPIYANSLNASWTSLEAKDVLNQITSDFIYNNLNLFFTGNHNIINSNNIEIVNKIVSNNSINLTIKLVAGSWYDENNKLGQITKNFTTTILGFKIPATKIETKAINPIYASSLGLNSLNATTAKNSIDENFIYNNISKFLSGSYEITDKNQIKIISKEIDSQVSNTIRLTFTLEANTWYESTGQLGNSILTLNTGIINFKKDGQKAKTKIINPISASSLGWSNFEAKDKLEELTSSYIYLNKNIFFYGDNNINSINNIIIESKTISNNSINLAIKLVAGSWYDEQGQLGNYDKEFNTIIQNFKKPIINVETKVINPIQASNLGFNNILAEQVIDQITSTFIYTNINKFLKGSYHITNESQIKIISKEIDSQVSTTIRLTFTLEANTWYDANGNLGTNSKEFTTEIINFLEPAKKQQTQIIKPIAASSLSWDTFEPSEKIQELTSEFIFSKIQVFFSGDHEIKSANDIKIIYTAISNNSINLIIRLKSGTWYDKNGALSSSTKYFSTRIINFKQPNIKNKTEVINPIYASSLGWTNFEASQVIDQITNEFIYNHISQFLTGSYEITDKNQILDVTTQIENGKIKLSFTLSDNTWYDDNNQLVNDTLTLNTEIIQFKQPEIKEETKIINPIDASSFGWEQFEAVNKLNEITETFAFIYIDKFFSGNHNITSIDQIEITSKMVVNNTIELSIKLKAGTWYDTNNKLGDLDKSFNTVIQNFAKPNVKIKTEAINPIEAKDIDLANIEVEQAYLQISNEFIFSKLNKFLTGSYEITDKNQILNILTTVSIEHNKLILTFTLEANTWYDANGNLGTNNKEFTTEIINFLEPTKKQQTQIINPITASSLNWDTFEPSEKMQELTSEFIFSKIQVFFSGDHEIKSANDIEIINTAISNNSINLSIRLKSGTWYDKIGQLGQRDKKFTTIIINFKQPNIKNKTEVINPMYASSLGWTNFEASQVIDQITNEFIYNHISQFLTGSYEITDKNQILDVTTQIENNEIKIWFTLLSGAWYEKNDKLANINGIFTTKIIEFKQPEIKEETKIINPIDASAFGWEQFEANEKIGDISNDFIYKYLSTFFKGDHKIDSSNSIIINSIELGNNNTININLSLISGSWYDENGQLGTFDKNFETIIQNFDVINETRINNPLFANQFNWSDLMANEVSLTTDIINIYKDTFFTSHNITNTSDILNISTSISQNAINITITLNSNAWYDEQGHLGTTSKDFTTVIKGFKAILKTEIIANIDASNFGWSNEEAKNKESSITSNFIFLNLSKFFIGETSKIKLNSITIASKKVNINSIEISITLAAESFYSEDNILSTTNKTFTTIINNFKILKKTQVISPIRPINFGWNNFDDDKSQYIGYIDNNFIFKYLNYFILGDHNITSANQITNVQAEILNNDIKVSFSLAEGSFYSEDNVLSTTSQEFNSLITNASLIWRNWWSTTLLCVVSAIVSFGIVYLIIRNLKKVNKIK